MNVGIITGGSGNEREISLASAREVAKVLDIPKENIFDFPYQMEEIKGLFPKIDIIIPIIHGEGGEDGEVQLLLESMDIPYIFSSPDVHRNCLDKRLAKSLLNEHGILSPLEFNKGDCIDRDVFVKPLLGGSSKQISRLSSRDDVSNFVESYMDVDFIVEEAVSGREFTTSVINVHGNIKALPTIEIKSKSEFFDYDSKYNEKKLAEEICPADITEKLRSNLEEQAILAHKIMGCKNFSRSDFIVTEEGEVYFLEINSIPGMTKTSLFPNTLAKEELSFKEVFLGWLEKELE